MTNGSNRGIFGPSSVRVRQISILAIVAGAIVLAIALIAGPGPLSWIEGLTTSPHSFSHVDDFNVQYRELVDYVESDNRPHQITQGDLKTHRKVSQYTDIDSSPAGYGKNACALVAAAAALGGENWVPRHAEAVTRWAVVISGDLVPAERPELFHA